MKKLSEQSNQDSFRINFENFGCNDDRTGSSHLSGVDSDRNFIVLHYYHSSSLNNMMDFTHNNFEVRIWIRKLRDKIRNNKT